MILNVSGAVQQEISHFYQFLYDVILVVFSLVLHWFLSLVILEMQKYFQLREIIMQIFAC